MSSSAAHRIEALSNHLAATAPTPTSQTMLTEKKPPITCHVLDTTIGRPGASIPVVLTLLNPSTSSSSDPLKFRATTNADGRVTSWTPASPFSSQTLEDVFHEQGDKKYSLTFDTERYFGDKGVKTFFPEVEVKFVVREGQKGEHFHVPVLLGPFGYTTYRGS
jgi:5-hydroxyisourate hydrolase